jgi:hypothetical protein
LGIEGPSTAAQALALSITSGEAGDFEERWAAWRAHERATRRKMAIALPSLFVVAAIVAYVLLRR